MKISVSKDRTKNLYIPAYRATRKCTLNRDAFTAEAAPSTGARARGGQAPGLQARAPRGAPRTRASAGEFAPGARGRGEGQERRAHTGPVTYSVVEEKSEITGPVSEERNTQKERKPSFESRQEYGVCAPYT